MLRSDETVALNTTPDIDMKDREMSPVYKRPKHDLTPIVRTTKGSSKMDSVYLSVVTMNTQSYPMTKGKCPLDNHHNCSHSILY